MTTQSHFQSAAQRGAMNGSDNRLFTCFHFFQQLRQTRALHRLTELTDVCTRNKGATITHNEERFGVRISLTLLYSALDSGANSLAQRIHRWIVNGDYADGAFAVIGYDVGHRSSLRKTWNGVLLSETDRRFNTSLRNVSTVACSTQLQTERNRGLYASLGEREKSRRI